ncbi:ATP-grasp domain-containing protein [Streptomyces celluloflavus]|uniref:ATP-grasp domain-containing protein n=1 Tax=Streptomyces celluloflavus TaxID=58344 RepID=UPI00367962BC
MESNAKGSADVWMLVFRLPESLPIWIELLQKSLHDRFGPRFAVWHTDELLFGVRGGELALYGTSGCRLSPPKVVYVRHNTADLRPDHETSLLHHLEQMGVAVFNSLAAHTLCANKVLHLQRLAAAGIPVPDTISYAAVPLGDVVQSPLLPEPCIVKSVRGNCGRAVFLAPQLELLREMHGNIDHRLPLLFQQYISSSRGRTLRVLVVDGQLIQSIAFSASAGRLKSNASLGGNTSVCTGRYPEAEEIAIRAAKALGLVFGAVDFLFDEDSFIICEVNANPGWVANTEDALSSAIADYAVRLLNRTTALP